MEKDWLPVAHPFFDCVHLRIDMAVGNQNVRPAIVIEVYKASSPGHVRKACLGNLRRPAYVFKTLAAKVAIKRFGLIGKRSVDDVEPSVVVVIAEVHSHVALLEAFAAQS